MTLELSNLKVNESPAAVTVEDTQHPVCRVCGSHVATVVVIDDSGSYQSVRSWVTRRPLHRKNPVRAASSMFSQVSGVKVFCVAATIIGFLTGITLITAGIALQAEPLGDGLLVGGVLLTPASFFPLVFIIDFD